MEDQEETILQLFAQEAQDMDIELCSKRWYRTDLKVVDSKNETFIKYWLEQFPQLWRIVLRTSICPAVEPPPEEYEFEKDEL